MYESLERELRSAGPKAEYDEHAKRILAHKIVLAHILVNAVPEFTGLDPEEVVELIEGEPEISSVPVYPGETNNPKIRKVEWEVPVITGSNIESKIPYEGTVTYDVRFSVWAPNRKEKLKILVDIEAQKEFNLGYDIVTRAVFYAARMLSAQLDTEFKATNYDDIKKVYSIWICMNTPKDLQNSITKIYLEKQTIYGKTSADIGRYDLLGVIIVGLSKELINECDESGLHRLLGAIFSPDLPIQVKKEILQKEYEIMMSDDMERSVESMCNLSEAIEERGIAKGRSEGWSKGEKFGQYQTLYKLLKDGIISMSQVIEQTGESEEDFLIRLKELNIME